VAYAIFDTPAIHPIPGIKDLAHAGSDMLPPLVIATARLLRVLDDSSVNIALPSIQDELAGTPAQRSIRRRYASGEVSLAEPATEFPINGSSGPRSGTTPAEIPPRAPREVES
jgi:hypothetical protein